MRKWLNEYRDFINKGDVITIAIGLVMALYFMKIVTALLDGVINPIIAAIFGKGTFTDIGFDIGEARISIGLVIDAIINFLVVAFILFLIIKAYNNMKAKQLAQNDPEELDPSAAQVVLLTEIRDELRTGRGPS